MVRHFQNQGTVTTLCLLIALGFAPVIVYAQSRTPRPIALTGTDGEFGPGLANDIEFLRFDADVNFYASPVMNNHDGVAFIATLTGPGVTGDNDTGLWVCRGGQLECIAREGDAAPEQGVGVVYAGFGSSATITSNRLGPNICDAGIVGFTARVRGTGVTGANDEVVFRADGNTVSAWLREGETALPDFPGTVFGNATNDEMLFGRVPNMTADGRLLLRTRVRANGSDNPWDVIVNDLGGSLTTFYRGAHDVQDLLAGSSVFWLTNEPWLTSSGDILQFARNTDAASVGHSNALYSNRGGLLEDIFAQGDVLPGGGVLGASGAPGSDPIPMAVNSSGAFAMSYAADDFGSDADLRTEGLFGVPIRIAITTGPAPGTGGGTFGFLSEARVMVANNGHTVFASKMFHQSGIVNSTNDLGIWSNRSGLTLNLELREGQAAPGTSGLSFTRFPSLFLNGDGRLAFIGYTNDSQRGLWVQDVNGDYELVVKSFDAAGPFDLFGDGSDERIIADIIMDPSNPTSDEVGTSTNTGNGRPTPFNDDADAVFRLQFIDGSEGIFSTSLGGVSCTAGDMNNDGTVDGRDLSRFVSAMIQQNATTLELCAGDLEAVPNGIIDHADLAPFVAALLSGN
ncbi:MAG: hypothetical protein MI923_02790 [Phycisphaerales bacterium]|nr:hypothetical protein [Phycisphaerales bacterium]